MENKGHLINQIVEATGLPDRGKVERATESALRQLHERLGPEADHLEAQLPEDVKPMFAGSTLGKLRDALTPSDKFHFDEMVQRVADEGEIDRDTAAEVTTQLFHQLKSHISDGEARHVASVLPSDMQRVWERA